MRNHFFAGAVTPVGFVNFFDHVMPTDKAKLRIFLKGSSGSGKSTFIKKIAAAFEKNGEQTERFHCSNDAESLDALAIPERGISFTDATSPHSRDPEIPGAIDKIIDFGQFIDEKKIIRHLDELKSLMRAKKLQNEKTAEYMSAAGKIFAAENKLSKSFSYDASRKLFLSAVTPDGYVSFAEEYFADCTVRKLENFDNQKGAECFYNPLAPERIDYLFFPQTKIVYAATSLVQGELFNDVIAAAINSMRLSKSYHAKIEEIYASTINFKKIRKLTNETIRAILS